MIRAVLGFVTFVFLILFIIILVARGGDSSVDTQPSPSLNSAADSDSVFRFTESGPIVASENHYNIEISINRSNRTVRVIRGYEGQVVASKSLGNNKSAFDSFLSSLDRSGYTKKRSTRIETEEGICPLGRRYIFESDQFGEDFRSWTTDCQERGNFGGNFSTVRSLFMDQIPEYSQFLSDTRQSTGLIF